MLQLNQLLDGLDAKLTEELLVGLKGVVHPLLSLGLQAGLKGAEISTCHACLFEMLLQFLSVVCCWYVIAFLQEGLQHYAVRLAVVL